MKIATFVLFLLSGPLFARSPAVEPVTGISIEEYREVDATTTTGYNFTREEPAYEHTSKDTQLTPMTALFLIIASALPFVVWFGIMRALPDGSNNTASSPAQAPTLSIIKGEGKPSHDEDDTWPKAS